MENLTNIESKLISLVANEVINQFSLPDIEDEGHYKFKTKLRNSLEFYLTPNVCSEYSLHFEETEDFLKCIFKLFLIDIQTGTPKKPFIFEINIPLNKVKDDFYDYRNTKYSTTKLKYPISV
jgi:hypothetical protein